jgi:hypothetical protein
MANRSYLYAVDTAPTPEHRPDPIRGISEHNWGIPLLHLLLAGRDTRGCPSMIWEHPIGIVADYAGGVDLATRFLQVLGDGETAEHGEVRATAAEITTFLADPDHTGRFFLLETGEILALAGDEFVAGAQELVADTIPAAVARAEAAIAGGEAEWLAGVLADWPAQVDSFSSEVLYFSF